MAEIERTTATTTSAPVTGGATTQTVTSRSAGPAVKAELIIRYLVGVLLALLGIRFVLSLLGALETNGFASFIYTVTAPFVAPFFGLFGYSFQAGQARFEIETLVAMAVYTLIGYGISRLLRLTRA